MRRFFLLIITCLAIAGAVSDRERVEVNIGENVTLNVEIPGNVSRVTLMLQKKCENRTEEPIIRYCSPEEEKRGCTVKKSDRFRFDTESSSVTFADARTSDEGCYIVSYIDVDNLLKEKFFEVTVNETPWTIRLEYLNIIAVGIALLTAVLVIIYVINHIINCQKKKQNNTEHPEEIISLSSASRASKPTTDESLEMVDVIKSSVDNNKRSKKDLNHGA
ncbi:uncharacterized protein LOC109048274 isoform X1 [Cyprinus carpio]|uniref:Uncharacterized protein LOC109048274 isoform X1 n=1 Tax=Cyprinus carpio TaxID=7962 RepID=A0A9R0ARY1_CYPCA|nr:uncharacterized protein LOC109048274 isoform X1 [Cyprinus carpio]